MANSNDACCIARPARHVSPNARARLCSIAACPTTRPRPCWLTWPMAVASARPADWSVSARTRSSATACVPAVMPASSTTSWWAFPPSTTKIQVDEKWSFVAKKQKNCKADDEADWFKGDQWDHVALDPDSRLVLEVVVGPRTQDSAEVLLGSVRDRLGGRVPELVMSDEYPVYAEVLLSVFGEERVPAVEARVVFGELGPRQRVSTSYLERYNGTDRHRNARKGRKSYCFSKDWEVHEAMTCFSIFSYNFCWPVRTLRQGNRKAGYVKRTPAMVADLTDHVWSLEEWLTLPAVQ